MLGEFDMVHPQSEDVAYRTVCERDNSLRDGYHYQLTRFLSATTPLIRMNLPYDNDRRHIHLLRQHMSRLIYHNYTSRPIVVVGRTGLPAVILPEPRASGLDKPCFLIRKELTFDDELTLQNSLSELNRYKNIHCPELMRIKPLLARESGYHFGKIISVEYVIPEEEVDQSEMGVYHIKSDTLLYRQDAQALPPSHPYCGQFVSPSFKTSDIYPDSVKDLQFAVKYINNSQLAKPLFVSVLGKVFTIRPQIYQPSKLVARCLKDGSVSSSDINESTEYVELFYPKATRDGEGVEYYRCVRLSIDDAKLYYGFHESAEDAAQSTHLIEAKIRKLNDKYEQLVLEKQRMQTELNTKSDILERKYQELQIDHDKLKKSNAEKVEKIKTDRETQMHEQRMSNEHFKAYTGIISGLLGMIPLFVKILTMAA